MKIISSRRFALWWQLAMDWFQRQFAAIAASIDFTPVEEKVDEVKSDVAEVKTAVENIDFSALAKQGTNANATLTAVLEALTGGGEIEIMTDDEYEPALSDLENMLDDIDITDEN